MFNFLKKTHPKTLLINNFHVLAGDQLIVESIWQQRHATSNIALILGRTIDSTTDPLDQALSKYMSTRALPSNPYTPLHTFAFSHDTGCSGTLLHHGSEYQLSLKGMPEHVLQLCDMSENERETVNLQINTMSSAGLYVVAIASANLQRPIKHIKDLKEKLNFVGLVGLQLNLSSSARNCIETARTMGVSLYFATGLHPTAAHHLGAQMNIATKPGDVFDARRLDVLRPEELITLLASINVFARGTTEQKVRILHTLQAIDETTRPVNTIEEFAQLLAK